MKKVDSYIIGSVLKTTLVTLGLLVLVLLLFDVFSNLDRYLSNNTSYADIAHLAWLYIPEAIVLGLGPSVLFSTTFFLSMLHANNELIVLFNTGLPYRRIIAPCIVMGILLSIFQFGFNERIAIAATKEKTMLTNEIFNMDNSYDNRNVTLRSEEDHYILHAGRYYEKDQKITNVIVVMLDSKGRLSARINAESGFYNGSYWELHDADRYLLDVDSNKIMASQEDIYRNAMIDIEPVLFRNLTTDVKTLQLESAIQYIARLKRIDSSQYAMYATELYNRIFNSLTPLILIIISCSTIFAWKKNVLVFSIITSLAIAVVYYVLQMVSIIFAKQGVIHAATGVLAPMATLLVLSLISILLRRK
ncbi:MAG: LptF/LptG family permease [Sphaerochaetaceae bacterium]